MNELEFDLSHITLAGLSNRRHDELLNKTHVVLALHGWLDNAASFTAFLPMFDDHDFVALDFAGHGKSQHRPKGTYYYYPEYVADIVQLIEIMGWESVILVGHSMGGMISSGIAAVASERIEKMILIEALGIVTTKAEEVAPDLRRSIKSRARLSKTKQATHPTLNSAVDARVAVSDLSAVHAELLVKRSMQQVDGGFSWRSDPALRITSAIRYSEEQAKALVASITTDTTLLIASDGMDYLQGQLKLFRDSYQHLTIETVPGGHHCHMEYPDVCVQHIKTFIKGLD